MCGPLLDVDVPPRLLPSGLRAPRVLLVASEIYPLAKSGGLADVCAALPKALRDLGIDVRLLLPAYPGALDQVRGLTRGPDLGDRLYGSPARLLSGYTPDSNLPVWLLDCPPLYSRAGSPYHDAEGVEWPDNALRYGTLCRAAAMLACGDLVDWRADVVHCNDWHTGLVPLLLRMRGPSRPRSVFTVHNAAFHGSFPMSVGEQLRLPHECLTADGLEFYGQLSFLKGGIVYADRLTTVSPTYARELRTSEYGCGLDGVFEDRAAEFVGIMNGIDPQLWNPATDPFIAHRYSADALEGKRACKHDLQQRLGLIEDVSAPLAISASRLTRQKMADVLLDRLPSLMQRHPTLQFALVGRGDGDLQDGFAEAARAFPGRIAVEIGYRESSAHRLHAGGDLLLHGSRFEPCGLTQLYAMRYGTIPVVRRVGGLADSVFDADAAAPGAATGFAFDDATGEAFESAIERCLRWRGERPDAWMAMRERGMRQDFGWNASARAYLALYRDLLGLQAPAVAQSSVTPIVAVRGARPLRAKTAGPDARSRTRTADELVFGAKRTIDAPSDIVAGAAARSDAA